MTSPFFLRFPRLPQSQRGDTLVEVLIAIAVVSLILGGAYIATSQSLTATRAAQERGNALKLAESQLERIKGLAATDPTSLFAPLTLSPFCISAVTQKPVAATSDDCAVDTSGMHPSPVKEPIFNLSIVRTGNDFVLTETWFNVSGKGKDKIQMSYRVYE